MVLALGASCACHALPTCGLHRMQCSCHWPVQGHARPAGISPAARRFDGAVLPCAVGGSLPA